MTERIPGYDNWKLASPPENAADCRCGHEAEEHALSPGLELGDCMECDCRGYDEAIDDPLDDGDAAYDAWKDDQLTERD